MNELRISQNRRFGDCIYVVVQHTIRTIYPKYYPAEVVDFFSAHHNMEAIARDIEHGHVSVLKVDENIVATGSFVDNHITRVYVLPEYQKKGYGTFIVKNHYRQRHFTRNWDSLPCSISITRLRME